MTADTNRKLIAVLDQLEARGLPQEVHKTLLGAPLETLRGLARKGKTISDEYLARVIENVEAGTNGQVTVAAKPDGPSGLPNGAGLQAADASAAASSETTIEAPIAALEETSESPGAAEQEEASGDSKPDEAPGPALSLEEIKAAEQAEEAKQEAVLAELLDKAKALRETDIPGGNAIAEETIRARLDPIAEHKVRGAVMKALKLAGAKTQGEFWAQCARKIHDEDYVPPTAEELAARGKAEAKALAEAEAHKKAETDELYEKCKAIADDPQLMVRMIEVVGQLGIVGEKQAILAAISRRPRA